MSRRTIFDHIPRTAGTSIKTALASALGSSGEIAEPSCGHHSLLSLAGERRFVAAHLWFYPGEPLSSDFLYATLLREPVDRFISQYFFFRGHRDAVLNGAMADPDVVGAVHQDLDAYVADPRRARSYSNVQARHFAWRMCEAPESLDDKSLLEAAIASLDEYDLVGVSPEAQAFIDDYCDLLSAPRQTLGRLNAATARIGAQKMSARSAERLWASNMVDTALYNWARKRFDGRRPGRLRRIGAPAPRANFGNREIRIVSSRCRGLVSGSPVVSEGEPVLVRLSCRASVAEPDLTIGIAVRDEQGMLVHGTNSRRLGMPVAITGPRQFDFAFVLDGCRDIGAYCVTLALHKGLSHEEGCYHWKESAASFLVLPRGASTPRRRLDVDDGVGNVRIARHERVLHDVRDVMRLVQTHVGRHPDVEIEEDVVF